MIRRRLLKEGCLLHRILVIAVIFIICEHAFKELHGIDACLT